MNGWIKLHRKFLKWEWMTKPDMVVVFLYLLLSANSEDGQWQGITIKRGQVITGRKIMSKNLKISEQKCRYCVERLKSTNEITSQATNRYTIITIVKYEDYQGQDKKLTSKTARFTANKQPTNNHEQEEEEEEEDQEQEARAANAAPPGDIFTWKDWLDGLKQSPRRDIRLIGDYLREKGIKCESKQQAEQELRRNLRAARDLTAWSGPAIMATIKWLRDQGLSWTMETIAKNVALYQDYKGRDDDWPAEL